jgi:hypothetical protein
VIVDAEYGSDGREHEHASTLVKKRRGREEKGFRKLEEGRDVVLGRA